MLDACRREFRHEAYGQDTWLSLGHTIKFAAIASGLFAAQIGLEYTGLPGWAVGMLGVVLALFQGAAYQALQLIAHDCGHGSFSRHRQLNRWVGHICSAPMLLNYAHWRRSHRLHHANVANIERDEAFGPKVRNSSWIGGGVQKVLRGMMWLPFVVYAMQILLPLTDKLKTPGYSNYFWPSRERESWVSFAFVPQPYRPEYPMVPKQDLDL